MYIEFQPAYEKHLVNSDHLYVCFWLAFI